MNRPNKVVITVTPDGEEYLVFDENGKEMSRRSSTTVSVGEGRANQKGDIYDDIPGFDEVAEAIEELALGTFDISTALLRVREEFEI
jgi:hypothetical protein